MVIRNPIIVPPVVNIIISGIYFCQFHFLKTWICGKFALFLDFMRKTDRILSNISIVSSPLDGGSSELYISLYLIFMDTFLDNPPTFDYTELDEKVQDIIDRVTTYMPKVNRSIIKTEIERAYLYARQAHEGQFRNSGEPYIAHPIETACIILSLKPDLTTIQACLLHDVAEDTSFTIDDIRGVFGEEVAHICEGLCKVSKLKYR